MIFQFQLQDFRFQGFRVLGVRDLGFRVLGFRVLGLRDSGSRINCYGCGDEGLQWMEDMLRHVGSSECSTSCHVEDA